MRGPTGGVRKYAESIKKSLEQEGHNCDWFYETSLNSLKDYDVVHIFSSFYPNLRFFRTALHQLPIVISPIYDPSIKNRFFIKALLYFSKLPGLYTNHSARKEMISGSDYVFTMSRYEKLRLSRDYNINFDSADIFLPTSYKASKPHKRSKDLIFIGDIGNPRQNIKRLIKAVSDTGLTLTLVGSCSDTKILEHIKKCNEVNYLGYVSEEQKLKEIQKHKVFVLPALTAGYGNAAVEAAEHRLKIIYTKYGGTSNYVNSSAIAIDPYSKLELRSALIKAIQSNDNGCLIERSSKEIVENLLLGYLKAKQHFLDRDI